MFLLLSIRMKKETHPKYNAKATAKCACGNTLTVGSTRESLSIDICSKCHPFYTGSQQLIDTRGRVERFKARQSKVAPKKEPKARVKKTAVKK
jgi:large subunit ribosomal protein L31